MLASDGTALLYHTTNGMWSILISCKEPLPVAGPPPLALYKGEVLTASITGMVLRYCQRASQWKECPELKVGGAGLFTHSIAMMSDRSKMYAIVYSGPHEKSNTTSYCRVFRYSSYHRWELIGDTGESLCIAPLESAALAGSALYIKFGGKMYKLPIEGAELVSEQSPKKQEFVQMKTPNMPLLEGSTLHAINNELFAFGGRDSDNQPTSDVLRYNPDTDTWESAGYMRSCRYNVAVVNVEVGTRKEVFVLGGSFGSKGLQISSKVHASTTTSTTSSNDDWECSTSMTEKCAL